MPLETHFWFVCELFSCFWKICAASRATPEAAAWKPYNCSVQWITWECLMRQRKCRRKMQRTCTHISFFLEEIRAFQFLSCILTRSDTSAVVCKIPDAMPAESFVLVSWALNFLLKYHNQWYGYQRRKQIFQRKWVYNFSFCWLQLRGAICSEQSLNRERRVR